MTPVVIIFPFDCHNLSGTHHRDLTKNVVMLISPAVAIRCTLGYEYKEKLTEFSEEISI